MAEITRYLKHRRDTAANWTANNPTLLAGQLGIETDGLTTTPKFKIGDGTSTWTALPYFYGGSASAQDLNNVLTVGNTTSGQDIVLTTDDLLKFGNTTAAIYNDSNIIDPNHVAIATNTTFTGHTHILLSDGANEWHDESASAFISIMVGGVPNNSIQLDESNDKINIFSGANGLNLQNDTYLNSVTASRLLSTDSNKKIAPLTGTGIVTLTSGVIGYDTNTYLTTSAAALAYQPLDSDLTSWAGVTRATGFDTFTATPSSANLSSLLTDKTGTGVNVFGTSPTFTTDITTPSIIVSGNISAASWTTNGIKYKNVASILTNTTSSGTVANTYTNVFGGNSIVSSSATTYTNYFASYFKAEVASTGSTITNNWALGADGAVSSTVGYGRGGTPSTNNPFIASDTVAGGYRFHITNSSTGVSAYAGLFMNNNNTYASIGLASTNATTVNQLYARAINFNNNDVGGFNFWQLGNASSGAWTNFNIICSTNTGQTASTEISNFKVNGASKTWAAGAITTQRWNYFTANTAAFASASTITNSYGLYVEAATAGTNATITNNYAAGFGGNVILESTTGVNCTVSGGAGGSSRFTVNRGAIGTSGDVLFQTAATSQWTIGLNSTVGTNDFVLRDIPQAATRIQVLRNTVGQIGLHGVTPTALLTLAAGTATASTAPLKFTTGTNLSVAEAGAMEYNNTFHLTNSDATRRHIVLAPNTTKVTAAAPYVNDGYIVINIGGTDFKVMTTA